MQIGNFVAFSGDDVMTPICCARRA